MADLPPELGPRRFPACLADAAVHAADAALVAHRGERVPPPGWRVAGACPSQRAERSGLLAPARDRRWRGGAGDRRQLRLRAERAHHLRHSPLHRGREPPRRTVRDRASLGQPRDRPRGDRGAVSSSARRSSIRPGSCGSDSARRCRIRSTGARSCLGRASSFSASALARLPGVMDWLKRPDRWRARSAPARADRLRRPAQPADLSHPSADPDRSPRGADRLGAAGAEGGQERLPRLLPARLRRPRARRRPSARPAAAASPTRSTTQATPTGWRRSRRSAGPSSSGSPTPAWGGESVWLERSRQRAGRSSLDFLGLCAGFAAEIPDYEPWICLDFLGFSRAKRDLSMGYERKTEKNFSCRFLPLAVEAPERTQRFWHAEGRIAHAASLP